MFRYEEYTEKNLDACDICEEQMEYLFELALASACTKFGR